MKALNLESELKTGVWKPAHERSGTALPRGKHLGQASALESACLYSHVACHVLSASCQRALPVPGNSLT